MHFQQIVFHLDLLLRLISVEHYFHYYHNSYYDTWILLIMFFYGTHGRLFPTACSMHLGVSSTWKMAFYLLIFLSSSKDSEVTVSEIFLYYRQANFPLNQTCYLQTLL